MLLRLLTFYLLGTLNAFALTPAEQNKAEYFQSVKTNPSKLADFLQKMPKGGDLHNHLTGASYAENMLKYGKNGAYCITPDLYIVSVNKNCPEENQLDKITRKPNIMDHIIDAWSMRNFHADKETGHDHFFGSFGKYITLADQHTGEILVEVTKRAAQQNESYLELMVTPDSNQSGVLGSHIGWTADLTQLRKKLLANGLQPIIQNISKNITRDENILSTSLQCKSKPRSPACNIKIRYLYQTLREQEPAAVFAQLLAGFEVADRDHRFVGINMVQPEDGEISMRDYNLHMHMVEYLHKLYPNVHISLHAGELIPGLVPESGLRTHIRSAIEIGHATRIGHGVDIEHEDDFHQLLEKMAKQHILVEINLVSNAAILNIEGKAHPILLYQQYNVPVALSTDDEGVLRTDLSAQYSKAVNAYNYDYAMLKKLVRNSIAYSFLPGKTLWDDYQYQTINANCANDKLGSDHPSKPCRDFLNKNEKANQQWELEHRFNEFEK